MVQRRVHGRISAVTKRFGTQDGIRRFPFFGTIFTLAVGCAIILKEVVLLPLTRWLRGNNKSPSAVMRAADGKFQLQRMVLEAGRYGRWYGPDKEYP